MPSILCNTKIVCAGSDDPISNYSSEAPDVINFGAIGFPIFNPNNPLGDDPHDPFIPTYAAAGCDQVCFSTISLQDAQDCAARDAYLCQNGGRNPPPNVPSIFYNNQQTCPFPCPDGSLFFWTVIAGTVVASSQALADQIASEIACGRAAQFHLCLPSLQGACANQPFLQTITMGGVGALTFTITAGALPPGLSLTTTGPKTAVLSGTPTAGGTFAFQLTVQDPNGNYVSKNYNFQVLQITPLPIPHPQNGTAYSQQLSAIGGTGPYLFTLELGDLPDGLTLSDDGIISGTPTTQGASDVTIGVQDSTNNFCAFDTTITVDNNPCNSSSIDWTNPGKCRLRIKNYVNGEFPICVVCNPGGGTPWDGTFSIIPFPGFLEFVSDGTQFFSVSGAGFAGGTLFFSAGAWLLDCACQPGSDMVRYQKLGANPIGTYATTFGCTGGEPATIEVEGYSL